MNSSRHSYTARKKLEIVECAEREGNRATTRMYPGINETSIRNWRKLKDRLLAMDGSSRADRGKISAVPVVEKALLDWVEEVRSSGTAVDYVDVMLKARHIITDLALPDCKNFKASRNWVYGFIKRHGLRPFLKKGFNSKGLFDKNASDGAKLNSDCVDHSINRGDILEELAGKEPSVCEYCGKSFATKATLTTHQVMHTGEKPHKCTICGKSYGFMSSLLTHIGTHTKPYECETCGKGFSDPYLRKRHEKVHLKGRPTSSDPRPGSSGRSYNAFEKIYRCDVCSKSFTTKNMLTRHFGCHSVDNGNTDGKVPDDEVAGLIAESVEIKEEAFETEEPIAKQSLDFLKLVNQVVDVHNSAVSRQISLDTIFANFELDGGRAIIVKGSRNDALKSELHRDARRLLKELQRYDLVTQVKGEYQLKCYLCEKVFTKFDEFVAHMKSYVMGKIYSCSRCKKHFKSNSYLRTHICHSVKKTRKKVEKGSKKVENRRLKGLKSSRCNFALKNRKCRRVEKSKTRKKVDCNENLNNVTSLEQSVSVADNFSSIPSMEVEGVDVVSDGFPSGLIEIVELADAPGEIGTSVLAEDETSKHPNSLPCKVSPVEGKGKVSVSVETLLKDRVVELPKESALNLETFEGRDEIEPEVIFLPDCVEFLESAITEEGPGGETALTELSREIFDSSEVPGRKDKIVTHEEESPNQHMRNFWDDFKTNLAFESTKTTASSVLWPRLCGNELAAKPRKAPSAKCTGEPRHECNECGKLFRLKAALKRHRCARRERSECVSDDWCRHSARIRDHRNSSRGEPSNRFSLPDLGMDGEVAAKSVHVCGICNQMFSSPTAMKRHIQAQHPKPVISSALPVVNHSKNILGKLATFFSTSCSVKTDVVAKPHPSGSRVSIFGLDSSLDHGRGQMLKKANENYHGRSFLFNYSYDERPYGCGLCREVFRTKDETLNHFVTCISLDC